MNDRDIAALAYRIGQSASFAVWPLVGGVIGTLIGAFFGAIVEVSVPLWLGVLIGAGFVALGIVAGVAFSFWIEVRRARSRSRNNWVA
ncbi:hypothetical protein [Actinomadura coerulea]|uniref:hypothetical protein n=1 Tax=Actinomadura coerulea TaxID=46159 RepID=UPI00341C4548